MLGEGWVVGAGYLELVGFAVQQTLMQLHFLQQVEAYVHCFALGVVAAELVSEVVGRFVFVVKAFLALGWVDSVVVVLLVARDLLVLAYHWAAEKALYF